MRWRLIALDLDGTLFPSPDATVAPEDRQALGRAAAQGALVIMVTGRHRRTALGMWRQLDLPPAPAVFLHGAEVVGDDGVTVRHRSIPRVLARECLSCLRDAGAAARVDGAAQSWLSGPPEAPGYHLETDQLEPDLHRTLPESARQLVVAGRAAALRAVRALAHLQGRIQLLPVPDWDQPQVLHVLHPEATKGLALAYLAARHGIPRRAVLAAGDSWPDMSMIAFAGYGVAMAGAPAAVRAVARRVMPPEPGWLARLLTA